MFAIWPFFLLKQKKMLTRPKYSWSEKNYFLNFFREKKKQDFSISVLTWTRNSMACLLDYFSTQKGKEFWIKIDIHKHDGMMSMNFLHLQVHESVDFVYGNIFNYKYKMTFHSFKQRRKISFSLFISFIGWVIYMLVM